MKKGEIWIAEFPDSHGREQSGSRPLVLIARAEANISIVIPLTSNLQALRFPHTVEVEPSKKNGLNETSVALVFQLRAIDSQRINKKLGRLEEITIKKIDSVIQQLLQLP